MRDRPAGHKMVRCSKVRAMFAMRACRKSVMIGMSLTHPQMTNVRLPFFNFELQHESRTDVYLDVRLFGIWVRWTSRGTVPMGGPRCGIL